jgi:hypothetical protein
VEQSVPLVEPFLDFGIFGGDEEMRFADASHIPRLLARTAVERLSVKRMAQLVRPQGRCRLGRYKRRTYGHRENQCTKS